MTSACLSAFRQHAEGWSVDDVAYLKIRGSLGSMEVACLVHEKFAKIQVSGPLGPDGGTGGGLHQGPLENLQTTEGGASLRAPR